MMMAKSYLLRSILCLFLPLPLLSQSKNSVDSKWRISGNAGLYFYLWSLGAPGEFDGPQGFFRNKPVRFIGRVSGLNIQRRVGRSWWLQADAQYTVNSGRQDVVSPNFPAPNSYIVENFRLQENSFLASLGVLKDWQRKKIRWTAEAGLTLVWARNQTIDYFGGVLSVYENEVFDENAGEIGPYIGGGAHWKIDTRFSLGLQSRVYYMVSVSSFEGLTLTPTLTYHF